MWRSRLTTLAIQFVVFLLLAELIAVVYYFWDTARFYYTDRPQHALIEETARGELTGDVLHPYFGPLHRPGVREETNNVGFGSPHAFPYARKSDRELLLGIFGGSVARQFCDRGVAALSAALTQQRRWADREIVPLCMAHEGYKQPQQLLVLSYFLSVGQQFDIVVNIDGFNEVALGTYNNDRARDVSMPSPLHLDPIVNLIDRSTMTPDMLYTLAAINRAKERLNELAPRIANATFASWGFVLERYYQFTRNQYSAELTRYASISQSPSPTSLVRVTPPFRPREGDALYADIANGWATASLLMRDMLSARTVTYLHVLQPNQYHSQHRFSSDEAAVALNPETSFKPPVERGYPVLRRRGETLATQEPFLDATPLFDDEALAVYADDCCHYTDRGYVLLGEAIARRLAAP